MLLLMSLMATGCASGQGAEIAALQERIDELEAAAMATTTTTIPPTTTTTTIPTTTTTLLVTTTNVQDTLCWDYWTALSGLTTRHNNAYRQLADLLNGESLRSLRDETSSVAALSTDFLLIAVETEDLGFGVVDQYTEYARRLYLKATEFSSGLDLIATAIETNNRYTWDSGVSKVNIAASEHLPDFETRSQALDMCGS